MEQPPSIKTVNFTSKQESKKEIDNFVIDVGKSGLTLEEAKQKIETMRHELREADPLKERRVETPEWVKKLVGELNECFEEEMPQLGIQPKTLKEENLWMIDWRAVPEGYSMQYESTSGDLVKMKQIREVFGKNEIPKCILQIAHEMQHLNGYRKSYLNKYEDEENQIQELPVRAGYFILNTKYPTKGEKVYYDDHFTGLNEVITEKITAEFVYKYWDKLVAKRTDMTKPDISKYKEYEAKALKHSSYEKYFNVINQIINQISAKTGKTEQAVWEKIKKGYYTGDLYTLREIEEVFGPGSLRILGEMGTLNRNRSFTVKDEESGRSKWQSPLITIEDFKKYFDLNIPENERQQLMKKYFGEGRFEGDKYLKIIDFVKTENRK